MLLTGTYRRALDDKLRLAIPKPWREILADQNLYLTPGTDKALFVYSGSVLEEIGGLLSGLSPVAKETRSFSRLFYAQAQPAEIDKQGRMRIPPDLAELAGLEGETAIVGVRDRLEVWNAGLWDKFLSQAQPSYDELAEQVFENAAELIQTRTDRNQ